MSDPAVLLALLAWGTLVGLDLVSFPQGLLSRPVVAASVAGLLAGDPAAGFAVGVLLELYALDLLPVGAARYPDFGMAAVGGAVAMGQLPEVSGLGPAAVLALLLAVVGGRSLEWQRRANGRRVRAVEGRLAAGDPAAVAQVQMWGLATDAGRALAVTGLGLVAAWGLSRLELAGPVARALTLVVVAGGIVSGLTGTLRRAEAGAPRWGLLLGLLAGVGVAWLV